jgi:hypothetical protein
MSARSAALSGLGHSPPHTGDAKRLLARGKVVLGGLIGDSAVLQAMRSNEDDTNRRVRAGGSGPAAYRPPPHHERARDDERRHREWIIAKLSER